MGVFTHTCDIAGAEVAEDEELLPAAVVELVLEVVLRARIRSNVFSSRA